LSRRSTRSIWIGVVHTVDVLHDREPSGSKCVGDKKCTRVRSMGRDAWAWELVVVIRWEAAPHDRAQRRDGSRVGLRWWVLDDTSSDASSAARCTTWPARLARAGPATGQARSRPTPTGDGPIPAGPE
jgi:hypothetical protein